MRFGRFGSAACCSCLILLFYVLTPAARPREKGEMRVFDFPFRIEIGSVLDLDFMPDGTCVTLQGGAHQQFLIVGNERFFLPPEWGHPENPFLRVMSDGRILIVDTSPQAATAGNAWILSISRPGLNPEPAQSFFTSKSFRFRSWTKSGARFEPENGHGRGHKADQNSSQKTDQNSKGSQANSIRPPRHPQVELRFTVEPSAVEITCLWGMIAVAYHPLSAKAHGYQIHPLQRSGIAFYDHSGRPVMGLSQILSPLGLSFENVRCMAGISNSQLLFVPEKAVLDEREVQNPIVLFDCASRQPKIYSAPFGKAEACTLRDGLIHLSSPEGWEDQIITFDPETKISQHRGEFLGVFRSLEGGAFLAQLTESDYAVVLPGQPPLAPPPQRSTLELLDQRN